jgi:hypothetical protein
MNNILTIDMLISSLSSHGKYRQVAGQRDGSTIARLPSRIRQIQRVEVLV